MWNHGRNGRGKMVERERVEIWWKLEVGGTEKEINKNNKNHFKIQLDRMYVVAKIHHIFVTHSLADSTCQFPFKV